MSPRGHVRRRLTHGFPRVSGDEPGWEDVADLSAMFSPRERG